MFSYWESLKEDWLEASTADSDSCFIYIFTALLPSLRPPPSFRLPTITAHKLNSNLPKSRRWNLIHLPLVPHLNIKLFAWFLSISGYHSFSSSLENTRLGFFFILWLRGNPGNVRPFFKGPIICNYYFWRVKELNVWQSCYWKSHWFFF